MISHLSTTLSGIETIRSYERSPLFSELAEKLSDYHTVEDYAIKFLNSCYGITVEVISSILVVAVYVVIVITRYNAQYHHNHSHCYHHHRHHHQHHHSDYYHYSHFLKNILSQNS